MARKAKTTSANSPVSHHSRFAGTYSIQFSGFGLGPHCESFHLAGVGRLHLDAAGALSGSQHSSLCPTTPGAAGSPPLGFQYGTFQLAGTYAIGADGAGTVSIDFLQNGAIQQTDVFRVEPGDAAMTRFWLISTCPTQRGKVVPELVSGEAVRLY